MSYLLTLIVYLFLDLRHIINKIICAYTSYKIRHLDYAT